MESTERSIKDKVLFRVQRSAHNISYRNFLASVLKAGLPGRRQVKGVDALNIAKTEKEILSDMNENGFSDFGVALNDDQLNAIATQLKRFKAYDTAKSNSPEVDLSNPAADVQLAHFRRDD